MTHETTPPRWAALRAAHRPRAGSTARRGSSGWSEYQRDLEQETADVADLIRRLKDAPPTAETTAPTTV